MVVMLISALSLTAQVNVTLRVDMNAEANVADTVSVAGSFQAAAGFPTDWTPGDAIMTDGDMDGVYEITFNLPSGSYEYKFVNAANWNGGENVPGACAQNNNRAMNIGANDTTFDVVCFGQCGPCPLAPPDTFSVILEVDMSNVAVATDTAYVAGSFQGSAVGQGWSDWTPDVSFMTDADDDSVYTIAFRLPEGTYGYKFLTAKGWGNDEGIPSACEVSGNRELALSSDTVIRRCFATCDEVCVPPLPPVSVTFQVDMSDEIPSADGVFIAGTIQDPNWQKNIDKMTVSPTNPDIQQFTVMLVPGEYAYKYFNGDYANSADPMNTDIYAEDADFVMMGCGVDNGIGGSNRLLDIKGLLQDTILPPYKYNTCDQVLVGIEDDLNGTRAFTISPNPFSGFTTVNFSNPNGLAYNVEVMNMNGQVVKRISDLRNDNFRLEAADLAKGMYLISLSNNAGERFTAKAIVK